MVNAATVIKATQAWVDEVVIALQLCPFAQQAKSRTRYQVSQATQTADLLEDLQAELTLLQSNSEIETSLLIHPLVLTNFDDYNQFLGVADELLEVMQLNGEIQIASFHPHYQFAGTCEQSAENYSNRSPYPMLHCLREASVSRAVDSHPDVHDIPIQNQVRLQNVGYESLRDKLHTLQQSE